MPLYVYRCPAAHETELLRPRTVEAVSCACGLTASRLEVNAVGISGFAETPREQKSYRNEFRQYREATAEISDANEQARKNGDPVREIDYLAIAKQRAGI